MNPLHTILKQYDIDPSSAPRAARTLSEAELDLDTINELARELVPEAPIETNLQLQTYAVAYLIQDIVKTERHITFTLDEYNDAYRRGIELSNRIPMGVVYGNTVLTTIDDETGEIRQIEVKRKHKTKHKNESKKAMAEKLFKANPDMSRADMVALLMKELPTTVAGAGSYYATLAKAAGKTSSARKGRQSDRKERIAEIYASLTNPTRAEFVDALVTQLQITRAAANTASYSVMPSEGRRGGHDRASHTKQARPTRERGPSREDLVREVFASREKWASREELAAVLQEKFNVSATAAKTYTYMVMPGARRAV